MPPRSSVADAIIAVAAPRPAAAELGALEAAAGTKGRGVLSLLRNAGLLPKTPPASTGEPPPLPHPAAALRLAHGPVAPTDCSGLDGAATGSFALQVLRWHAAGTESLATDLPATAIAAFATPVACVFVPPGTVAWARVPAELVAPELGADAADCDTSLLAADAALASARSRNKSAVWAPAAAPAGAADGPSPGKCSAFLQLAVPAAVLAAGDPAASLVAAQQGQARGRREAGLGTARQRDTSAASASAGVVEGDDGQSRVLVGPVTRLGWRAIGRASEPSAAASPGFGTGTSSSATAGEHMDAGGASDVRSAAASGRSLVASVLTSAVGGEALAFASWPQKDCVVPTGAWVGGAEDQLVSSPLRPCLPGHLPLSMALWGPTAAVAGASGSALAVSAGPVSVPSPSRGGAQEASPLGRSASLPASLASQLGLSVRAPGVFSLAAVGWDPGALQSARGRVVGSVAASEDDAASVRRTGASLESTVPGARPAVVSVWPLPSETATTAADPPPPRAWAPFGGLRGPSCDVHIGIDLPSGGEGSAPAAEVELRLASDWQRGAASVPLGRATIAAGFSTVLRLGNLTATRPVTGASSPGPDRVASIVVVRVRNPATGLFDSSDAAHQSAAVGVLRGCVGGPSQEASVAGGSGGFAVEAQHDGSAGSWRRLCSNGSSVEDALEVVAAPGAEGVELRLRPAAGTPLLRVAEVGPLERGAALYRPDGMLGRVTGVAVSGSPLVLSLRPASAAASGHAVASRAPRVVVLAVEGGSVSASDAAAGRRCVVRVTVRRAPPNSEPSPSWVTAGVAAEVLGGVATNGTGSGRLGDPLQGLVSGPGNASAGAAELAAAAVGACPQSAAVAGGPGSGRSAVLCADSGICSASYILCTDGAASAVLDASPAGLECRGRGSLVPARQTAAPGGVCSANRAPVAGVTGATAARALCRRVSGGRHCTATCAATRVVCGRGGFESDPLVETAPAGKACLAGEWVDSTHPTCTTVPDVGCLGAPVAEAQLRCAALPSDGGPVTAASSAGTELSPGAELRRECSPLVYTCDRLKRGPVAPAPPGTRCRPGLPFADASVLHTMPASDRAQLAEGVADALSGFQGTPPANVGVLLSLSAGEVLPADAVQCFESSVAELAEETGHTCPAAGTGAGSSAGLPGWPQATALAGLLDLPAASDDAEAAATAAAVAVGAAASDLAATAAAAGRAGWQAALQGGGGGGGSSPSAASGAAETAFRAAASPLLWRCVAEPASLCAAEASACPLAGPDCSAPEADAACGASPSLPTRGPPGTACFAGLLVPWDHDVCAGMADPVSGVLRNRLDPAHADAVPRAYAAAALVLEGVPAAAGSSLALQLGVRRALGNLYSPLLVATQVTGPTGAKVPAVAEQLILIRAFDAGAAEAMGLAVCHGNATLSRNAAAGLTPESAVPTRSLSARPAVPWALPLAPLQGEAPPAAVGLTAAAGGWGGGWGGGTAVLQVYLGAETSDNARVLANRLARDLATGRLERRVAAATGVGGTLNRLLLWNGTGCAAVDALDPLAPLPLGSGSVAVLPVVSNPRHPEFGFVPGPWAWWLDLPLGAQISIIAVLSVLLLALGMAACSTQRCCGRPCDGTLPRKRRKHGAARRVVQDPGGWGRSGINGRRGQGRANGRGRAPGEEEEEDDAYGIPAAVLPQRRPRQDPSPAVASASGSAGETRPGPSRARSTEQPRTGGRARVHPSGGSEASAERRSRAAPIARGRSFQHSQRSAAARSGAPAPASGSRRLMGGQQRQSSGPSAQRPGRSMRNATQVVVGGASTCPPARSSMRMGHARSNSSGFDDDPRPPSPTSSGNRSQRSRRDL